METTLLAEHQSQPQASSSGAIHDTNNAHGNNQQTSAVHAADSAHGQVGMGHAAEQHGAESGHESGAVPPAEVFNYLLKHELGDHHSFSFTPFIHVDLPKIFIDQGQFYFYPNGHAMTQAGVFTEHEGHPVRLADHAKPEWDFSITNFVAYQWIAIVLIFIAMRSVASKYKKNPKKAPSGFQNAIEALVVYVRDNVVRPNTGDKVAKNLLPYFLSLFFYILTLNLIGLLPGGHAATGSAAVTAGLALVAFLVVNFTAIKEAGFGTWMHHLLGGAPVFLAPIMIPIEVIGRFIAKPGALAVRLFANMTAGHIVLLSLTGLIFYFQSYAVAPVSVAFSLFIMSLELLVAFLQAYIFSMLVAVFIGLELGDHKDDHGHAHH